MFLLSEKCDEALRCNDSKIGWRDSRVVGMGIATHTTIYKYLVKSVTILLKMSTLVPITTCSKQFIYIYILNLLEDYNVYNSY